MTIFFVRDVCYMTTCGVDRNPQQFAMGHDNNIMPVEGGFKVEPCTTATNRTNWCQDRYGIYGKFSTEFLKMTCGTKKKQARCTQTDWNPQKKVECCLGLVPATDPLLKYKCAPDWCPDSASCEQTVRDYCRDNPSAAKCACFPTDAEVNNLNAVLGAENNRVPFKCVSRKCKDSDYKPPWAVELGLRCPSVARCLTTGLDVDITGRNFNLKTACSSHDNVITYVPPNAASSSPQPQSQPSSPLTTKPPGESVPENKPSNVSDDLTLWLGLAAIVLVSVICCSLLSGGAIFISTSKQK